MITITKCGKFIVPEEERVIGHAGDNLNVTKEIFVEGITDISLAYRMYLKFDDGTCNFFLLESEVQENGTMLVWTVTIDQIFKSGVVQVQIKASNDSGEVFHSNITNMLVQTSIEFTDYFANKENSEFLRIEDSLNEIYKKQEEAGELANSTLDAVNASITKANEAVVIAETVIANANKATEDSNELLEKIDEKIEEYNNMELDNYPTANSTVPVKSGGLYTEFNNKLGHSNLGNISSILMLDNSSSTNTLFTGNLANSFIGGKTGYTPVKFLNYAEHQLFILADGRSFSRNFGSSDFQQVGFTKDEIISSLYKTTDDFLSPVSSMASSGSYYYSRIGNIIHMIIDVTVKTPTDNTVSADFIEIPAFPVEFKTGTIFTLSEASQPYLVKITHDVLSFTPVDLATLAPKAPINNDTIHVELTYMSQY